LEKRIDLACVNCHTHTPLRQFSGACPACGETIVEARYDLAGFDVAGWQGALARREPTLWRYHELLPIFDTDNIVTLGEGGTPLIRSSALAASLGLEHLYFKDERQGPTGSFKDRQAAVAITALREMSISEAVVASTGNVAIAYAAYGARAGIHLWAFLPALAPIEKMRETALYGAEVIRTTGTYDQTKELAAGFARSRGIFLDKGIKSFAAIESMKTIAYEIAEQLGRSLTGGARWVAPDWFLQGVSGGMGPIGVNKGFSELMRFGLVARMPALGLIQSEGCAPMVEAFARGQRVATPVEHSRTVIATLATGAPGRAYEMLYDRVQQHGGDFRAVTDDEAFDAIRILAEQEGISVEPAVGVTLGGLFKMVRAGVIRADDVVVVNISGHTMPVEKRILDDQWRQDIDLRGTVAARTVPDERLVDVIHRVDVPIRRVVVVEDNETAARLMSRLLESRENCEVAIAHNGRHGMDLIEQMQPDLIITDLMMPDVDGFRMIEMIRAHAALREIPIVVVTAKELAVAEQQFLEDNTTTVLRKGSFIDSEVIEGILERIH
jgi:threonine synthase